MHSWVRQAEENIAIKDLSISYDESKGAYVVRAPWDPNQYVTYITNYKFGYAPRYILKRMLALLDETYPNGVDRNSVETKPVEELNIPMVTRMGNLIADKLRKKRKMWMPYEPSPRGWEDTAGNENSYASINRPEERWWSCTE